MLALLLATLLCACSVCHCRMTDRLRQEALDAHNYLRSNVYPEAVGMARLTWSSELEQLAEKAAKKCEFEHTTTREFSGKGENMYLGGKGNFTEILTMMFLERELYDFENQKCLAGTTGYNGPYSFFSTCGHYLQLVRADMTQVGCSINTCTSPDGSTNNLAVCEYESMYKEPPYRARKPGEKPCELCGYGGYATDCEGGMCILLDPESPRSESEVKRKCLNCGSMQSYGTFDYCACEDNFYGEVCENSLQSVLPRSFTDACDKCEQEGIECLNGATPVGTAEACRCVCQQGFAGKYCETDIEEERNTLHLYLGGGKRYNSYYPVDKSAWKSVSKEVSSELSNALSNYCTSGWPQVEVSSNYPATTINGSLKVGLHAKCGRQYLDKTQLEAALASSTKALAAMLARQGASIVAVD